MHGAEGVGELADLSLLIDAQRVAVILGWVKAVFDTVEVDLGVETGDS
jgi:predicted RNA methylase